MRLHGAIGSHNSHLLSVAFTPLSIEDFALIDGLSLSPPEPPRVSQIQATRRTRLVEARAPMCLEFANYQRFRRRCDKTVN